MAKIVKVIEIMSESSNSWEEATQNVVSEASKTLRNIRSVYVKEFTAPVAAKSNAGSMMIQSYSPLGPAMKPSRLTATL